MRELLGNAVVNRRDVVDRVKVRSEPIPDTGTRAEAPLSGVSSPRARDARSGHDSPSAGNFVDRRRRGALEATLLSSRDCRLAARDAGDAA